MDTYEELLRDLCRLEPNTGWDTSLIKLTNTQAAVVMLKFPDLLGEALADSNAQIAEYVSQIDGTPRLDLILAGIATEVTRRIKERAPNYIIEDLRDMSEQIEREDNDESHDARQWRRVHA